MKYLDNNEIRMIQKYLLEKEYMELYSGASVQNANSENDEFSSKKITTKIDIDFFTERVKIYLVYPVKRKKKKQENSENVQTEIFVAQDKPKNRLIIDKEFKIDDDYESVRIDGKTHLVPKYFNAESVKNQDEKTWEMIFYYIYKDEIKKEIWS